MGSAETRALCPPIFYASNCAEQNDYYLGLKNFFLKAKLYSRLFCKVDHTLVQYPSRYRPNCLAFLSVFLKI